VSSLSLPEEATLVEMLPRDGFQNFEEFVPTDQKIEIVDLLSTTGVDEIEITSFTHPKAVPNLRDADEVAAIIERNEDVVYRALVPNDVGMGRALELSVDKVNALVVVSDTYREKNQNMSLEENLDQVETIVEMAGGTGVEVEAGIGTSFFCPYEGRIQRERTLAVAEAVIEAGVDELTFATTMGMATPADIAEMLSAVNDYWPDVDCGLHLHDTNGMSMANTLVAMQFGVSRFDTSVCGLGGGTVLPDALQGVGNTPTEDVANMLRQIDVETDVDFERLETVAHEVRDRLDLDPTSHVLMGGTPENVLSASEGVDQ